MIECHLNCSLYMQYRIVIMMVLLMGFVVLMVVVAAVGIGVVTC